MYGSPESVEFTTVYFATIAYNAIKASMNIAKETGEKFDGFETSKYASGEFFDRYITQLDYMPDSLVISALFNRYGIQWVNPSDWSILKQDVMKYGMYNAYLQAVPPTGSISYINHATASIHPITAKVEIRKEGKIGRVYYPAYGMTNDNLEYYVDAYEIGYQGLIDVYAAATQHVDQGLSCTLFFPDSATTRDLTKARNYAWKKGLKSLYYVRIRQQILAGVSMDECVSCSL